MKKDWIDAERLFDPPKRPLFHPIDGFKYWLHAWWFVFYQMGPDEAIHHQPLYLLIGAGNSRRGQYVYGWIITIIGFPLWLLGYTLLEPTMPSPLEHDSDVSLNAYHPRQQ